MEAPVVKSIKNFKDNVWVCLKLTIIVFGIFFIVINQQFTLKGAGLTFLISAMYSFTLGLGNGMINDLFKCKMGLGYSNK